MKISGGKVVRQKETVMEIGYYAEIIDTEDNLIGLWGKLPYELKFDISFSLNALQSTLWY
ncbi:VOC family protein [Methanococcoides burtonii]|uniref:VOC family protein n=1 Tax=Methanococcoides burtonii TaxID=29291 RepID=UPI0000399567|nr:hypothetical protein [Methanococcoides burtonii]